MSGWAKSSRALSGVTSIAGAATPSRLVAKPGEEPDLCYTDPKFEMDLFVVCELRALTSA